MEDLLHDLTRGNPLAVKTVAGAQRTWGVCGDED